MGLEEIRSFLAPHLDGVESIIAQSLATDIELLDSTNRSIREHGGKMIRPILSLLSALACGRINGDTLRYAAAAEILHNATLLHDDVVDGASPRRGRPTVSALLGPGASVLIGDFWLVRCVRTVIEASANNDEVTGLFAKTLSDLSEGELLQMQKASSGDTSVDDYIRIVYSKTASLFETSARAAAISVKASPEYVEALGNYASALGIAFQIKDDIFDYVESPSTGKPCGLDLLEQKITMPLLCAFEACPSREAEIRCMVTRIASGGASVADITAFVAENDGVSRATAILGSYISKAVSCLEPLPASEAKSHLCQLAHFVGSRIA